MTIWRLFPEKLGNTSATTFVGDAGEVFYDPTSTTLRISDGSTPGGLTIGGGGGLQAEADTLQTVSTRGATSTNQLTMAGFITTAGSTVGGHLIPDTNEAYDLGSAEYKFRDLYLGSNTIHIGKKTISETNVDDSMEIKDASVPSSSTDIGNKGDVVFDDTHMYVCIQTNKWRRINLDNNW